MAGEGQYKFSIGLDDKQLQADARDAAKIFDSLVKQAQAAGVKIDEAFKNPFDELVNNPPRIPTIQGVAEATGQFNGLNMATQQLVRELPAASMGLNTLFLALSNNIPIFADQVRNLRTQGQSAGSILSQIGKSLLSWQTALVVGVTALSMYGKEIGAWIASLFKGKEALDATKEAQEGLNKAIKESGLGIGGDIVKLKELQREYNSLGANMQAKEKFITDNKDAFDDLGVAITNVVDADRLLVERTPEFIQAMMLRAQASAAKRIAEEKYDEWLRKRQEYIDERDAGVTSMDMAKAALENVSTPGAGRPLTTDRDAKWYYDQRITGLKTEAKEVKNVADSYFNLAEAYEVQANSALKAAGFAEPTKDPDKGSKRTKEIGDNLSFFRDADREMKRTSELLSERLRQQTADLEDYKIKYGTIQEQILFTTQKYNRLIAEAQTEGERMSLEAERDAILAQFEVNASEWAQSLVGKTAQELEAMMADVEAILKAKEEAFNKLSSSSTTDAKALREEINRLKAQLELLKSQDDGGSGNDNDKWANSALVFQGISRAAQEAAQAVSKYDEAAGQVLSTMGQLASSAGNLVSAISAVGAATSAAEKASGVLAIIAAAIQIISTIVSGIKSLVNDESYFDRVIASFKELNAELAQMQRLAQINKDDGSIFGDDEWGNYSRNLDAYVDSLNAYNDTVNRIKNRGRDNVEFLASVAYDRVEELRGEFDTLAYTWDSLEESIANMQVMVDHATWFSDRKYANLGDLVPNLFGEDGKLNMDALVEFKDSDMYDNLTKANRELIDQLILDWEYYEESVAAVNEYLSSVLGTLGAEISDALVDAFRNGTDAAEAFGDAASRVIERLVTDMAYAAILAPIFEDMENRITELNNNRSAMSDAEYMEQLMSIFAEGIGQVSESQDMFNEALEQGQKIAEELGYEAFKGDSTATQRKGIAQASQDSVNELNGRMTAIQSHTSSIMGGVQQLTRDSAQVLKHLASIERNTSELQQMRLDVSRLASAVDDMATRGVKMI